MLKKICHDAGGKRVKRSKGKISSLASFSPAFRDLWECRYLTPHAFLEPKGSYDRCTVLTRNRWMLSEEKRIGLSSQKMRERGKREKVCGIASPLYMSLCVLYYTQTQRIRKEKKGERDGLWCAIILCFILGMIFRGMCVLFWHRVTYVWRWIVLISLTHTNTYKALYI